MNYFHAAVRLCAGPLARRKAVSPFICSCLLLAATSGLMPRSARAQAVFNISINTAPLKTAPLSANGPFYLDFILLSGGGAGIVNTVTISHFTFGAGGSASNFPAASTTGGASGSLFGAVTLTDGANFYNEFYAPFTPGDVCTFRVTTTTNAPSGAGTTPDAFLFSLLDGSTNSLTTTGPSSEFVNFDITSPSPVPNRFAATGPYAAIGTPTVSSVAGSAPEPGSAALLLLGIGPAMAFRKRRFFDSVRAIMCHNARRTKEGNPYL